MPRPITPLGAVVRGAVAGALGTLAMDLVWFGRYRREGGQSRFRDWELSSGLTWDSAPPPAHVGKRIAEGLFQRTLPDDRAPLVNNVVHWTYGMWWGTVYGVVAGSARSARVARGVPFGTAVWASSYVVLPLLGLYRPIWEYDPKALWKDLSAHLAFGLGAAGVFQVLSKG